MIIRLAHSSGILSKTVNASALISRSTKEDLPESSSGKVIILFRSGISSSETVRVRFRPARILSLFAINKLN